MMLFVEPVARRQGSAQPGTFSNALSEGMTPARNATVTSRAYDDVNCSTKWCQSPLAQDTQDKDTDSKQCRGLPIFLDPETAAPT